MRAESYAVLFNFEDAIEDALATVLDDGTCRAFTTRSTGELTTPRFEPSFNVGAATGHKHRLDTNEACPDTFVGTITIRIITKRGKEPESHAPYRSRIREKLYQPLLYFREGVLPYHHFVQDSVREQSSTHSAQSDRDHDISEIVFSCKIGIREGAWPIT